MRPPMKRSAKSYSVDNNYPTESLVHVEYIRELAHLTHAVITSVNATKIGYPLFPLNPRWRFTLIS
jgi:hypothetical protein